MCFFCQANWAKKKILFSTFFMQNLWICEYWKMLGNFISLMLFFFAQFCAVSFSVSRIFWVSELLFALFSRKKTIKVSQKNNEHNFFDFAQFGVFIFLFWKKFIKRQGERIELREYCLFCLTTELKMRFKIVRDNESYEERQRE